MIDSVGFLPPFLFADRLSHFLLQTSKTDAGGRRRLLGTVPTTKPISDVFSDDEQSLLLDGDLRS